MYLHTFIYIYIHTTKNLNKLIQIDQTIPPSGRWRHCGVLRPTAVDACVNLQAQRLFVSRFRNNINFTAAVLVMSFEKLGDLLFENKTSCLTNVLLDHFRLVRVWFWESHHLWEGGAVDCSGLDLLIVFVYLFMYIYIYDYMKLQLHFYLELYTHYILLIFLASLPCKANVDSWIFHLPAGRCTFLKVLWWPPVIAGFSIWIGKNKENKKALLWSAKGMWSNRSIDQVLQ